MNEGGRRALYIGEVWADPWRARSHRRLARRSPAEVGRSTSPGLGGLFLTESTLGTVHPFISKARVLDPERTRIASEAFDLALQSLGETGYTLPSHRVRHLLASFIVERVMYDDGEPEQLALEAVESLGIIEQARA